jgi:hypothetical protein
MPFIESGGAVFVGETENALHGTEAVKHVDIEKLVHDSGHVGSVLGGLTTTPGRGALKERDFLGRVIGHVGRSAFQYARMGFGEGEINEHF